MSDLINIQNAVAMAARLVQATWQQTVMGATKIPGVPEIRANINLRQIYAESIVRGEQINIPSNIGGRIFSLKKIAQELEYGKGPWDMKPMLLGGTKARISKAGVRYNIIPFRHAVPGGTSNTAVGRVMPQSIFNQAKALRPGQKLTGTERTHRPGQNPTSGYQHKNGKYEGMSKISKTYEKATQSKYMTFRVVTSNSPAGSWIHPGYPAYHIAQGVSDFCKGQVEQMIAQAAMADLVDPKTLSIGMTITGN